MTSSKLQKDLNYFIYCTMSETNLIDVLKKDLDGIYSHIQSKKSTIFQLWLIRDGKLILAKRNSKESMH